MQSGISHCGLLVWRNVECRRKDGMKTFSFLYASQFMFILLYHLFLLPPFHSVLLIFILSYFSSIFCVRRNSFFTQILRNFLLLRFFVSFA